MGNIAHMQAWSRGKYSTASPRAILASQPRPCAV